MCRDRGSSRKWAEGVIEKAQIGDPSFAAYLMCRDRGSSKEWYENLIINLI